jgi:hypothetical protein
MPATKKHSSPVEDKIGMKPFITTFSTSRGNNLKASHLWLDGFSSEDDNNEIN